MLTTRSCEPYILASRTLFTQLPAGTAGYCRFGIVWQCLALAQHDPIYKSLVPSLLHARLRSFQVGSLRVTVQVAGEAPVEEFQQTAKVVEEVVPQGSQAEARAVKALLITSLSKIKIN